MQDINEIFEKRWNATETSEAWMFLQIYKLMQSVQEDTAQRETTPDRERLIAIITGLSDRALDKIRGLDMGVYQSYAPADGVQRFTHLADYKRRTDKERNNLGKERTHSATILEFSPKGT